MTFLFSAIRKTLSISERLMAKRRKRRRRKVCFSFKIEQMSAFGGPHFDVIYPPIGLWIYHDDFQRINNIHKCLIVIQRNIYGKREREREREWRKIVLERFEVHILEERIHRRSACNEDGRQRSLYGNI